MVLFSLLLLLAGLSLFYLNLPPPATPSSPRFVVEKGESLSSISSRLEETSLVRSRHFFISYLLLRGWTQRLQAGIYQFDSPLKSTQIAQALLSGKNDYTLTVLPGWRREQVALALPLSLRADFLNLTATQEGRLWPDTYFFPATWSADQITLRLSTAFEEKLSSLQKKYSSNFLTSQETLILASLLEREGKTLAEKRIIASVLLNRLSLGMPLQVDATVQYAKDSLYLPQDSSYWLPITLQEYQLDSPFNTYRSPGLPPSPICSPGLDSLEAAFNPASTDYFYYLTGKDGQTYFAKTLDQHQQNIQKHL